MKKQPWLKAKNGQSLVEFALVLPLLLLLLLGMTEVGMAFYDYIVVAAANREGVRMASRGRFEDDTVFVRIISSGGNHETSPGVWEDNLRTGGDDPNLGIIITHFPIDDQGALGTPTSSVTGTIYISGTLVYLDPTDPAAHSRIDGNCPNFHGDITAKINGRRESEGYDRQGNEFVVVETFYAHHPLLTPFMDLFNMEDPLTLYFSSSMRVMRDSRID